MTFFLFFFFNKKNTIAPSLEITKSVNNSTPQSGETFIYTIDYRCASTTEDCLGAFITDPLPAEVDFVDVVGSAHTTNEVYNSGTHTVTFTFQDPLLAGSSGQLEIEVMFPNGTTPNGTIASNSATMSASNAASVTSAAINSTASAIAKPAFNKYFEAGGAAGSTLSYSLRMCNTGNGLIANGTLNLTSMTIVDTLPLGTILLDVSDAWSTHTYDTLNRILTFTFTKTLEPGECLWPKVTVQVPSPAFNVGDLVTNNAWMTSTPIGESPVTLLGTDVYTLTVANPGATTSKSINRASRYPGESLFYSIDVAIDGTEQLDDFCISDTIPVGLEVTEIKHGAYFYGGIRAGDSIVSISYTTNLGGPYLIAGSPFARWETQTIDVEADLGLTLGGPEYITVIDWCYGNVPAGLSTYSDIQIFADVKSDAAAGVVQNCTVMTSSTAGATFNNGCVDLTILTLPIGFRPSPGMEIKLSDGSWAYTTTETYAPGDTLTYDIRVRNGNITSSNLDNPIMVDLLPEELEYIAGSWIFNAGLVTAPPIPIFSEITNYKGTGRHFLKWEWTGASSVSVEPGDHMSVRFKAVIKDHASPTAALYNEYSILNETTNPCSGGNKISDSFDFDEDGSTIDEFCSDNLGINISSIVAVSSVHLVKGQLDSTWTKYPASGMSVPGGIADYKLIGYNNGNVGLKDVIVIDILPFVGDNGVIDLSARDSKWRPNLAAPVAAPAGVTVYYSLEQNPCRSAEGIEPSGPVGCTAPNWTTIPPADITTVQSIKFDYGVNLLNPGDSLVLEWAMRTPVNVLSTIGAVPDSIAWNSFAFIATRADNDVSLLPSEPIKTGISIAPLIPGVFGDYVWVDANQNGRQGGGESGYDGMRVELFKDNGDNIPNPAVDTFINFTVTANGGSYLFPSLATGDYFAVFYLPAPFTLTAPNQGGNDDIDSDGVATTFNGFDVAITPVTTVLNTQYELSLDMGMYLTSASAIGNYVWNDINGNGIQDESINEGINGVTVNLYDNSNPAVILATDITSNDINGNTGFYLFKNIPAGNYFLEFINPTPHTISPQGLTGSSDPLDSDINAAGRTEVFALAAGVYDDSWDAGIELICQLNITNVTVGNCSYNNGKSETTVDVEVTWVNAPFGENIEITIGLNTQIIDVVGGAISPATIQFTVPSDGTTGNTIAAQFSGGGCSDADGDSYTAPISCPTPSCIGINPLIARTYDIWHTGSGGGLDFSQIQTTGAQAGYPSTFVQTGTTSNMPKEEGGATYCHPSTGEMLIYSDGEKGWDKDGNEYSTADVSNRFNTTSTNLSSAAGTPLIVASPGQCNGANELYIFYTDDHLGATPELYYAVVDVPNKTIAAPIQLTAGAMSEQINAVQVSCDTIWIVYRNGVDMNAIRWTPSGFEAPVVTAGIHTSTDQRYRAAFCLDGNRFAATIGASPIAPTEYILVADFDQKTGQFLNPFYLDPRAVLSNPVIVKQNYGIAFSPDGTKLYTSINSSAGNLDYLMQFDLSLGTVANIQNSVTTIASKVRGIGGIQNAPDGRLYISNGDGANNGRSTVHVVDFPNLAGAACNFRMDFLETGGNTGSGLNNIVYGKGPAACIPVIGVSKSTANPCSELIVNTVINDCYLGGGGPYNVYYSFEGVQDSLINQVAVGDSIAISGLATGAYIDIYVTDVNGCRSNYVNIVLADATCAEDCENGIDDDLDGLTDCDDPDCSGICPADVCSSRVTDGLVALYNFKETVGDTVFDVSAKGIVIPLVIEDPANISRLPDCGISINSATRISSSGVATKIIDSLTLSNALTFEVWLKPANNTQSGPARIVTISQDQSNRNITIGQSNNQYAIRLRNANTSLNGIPEIVTPANSVDVSTPQHLVFTWDGTTGAEMIYLDGVVVYSGIRVGNLSNWGNYKIAIGNEFIDNRPWLGEIYTVAIYNKVLNGLEILQNKRMGYCCVEDCTNIVDDDGDGDADCSDSDCSSNDNDGDGICDIYDLDDDNDGILDDVETLEYSTYDTLCTINIFDFSNPVLESGTALSVGAVYRYTNVVTGTDALVEVVAITNSILNNIDNEGGTGFIDAFQPTITGTASGVTGVEFNFKFVNTGTSTLSSTLQRVGGTAYDIDGTASFALESYLFKSPSVIGLDANTFLEAVQTGNDIDISSTGAYEGVGIDPDYRLRAFFLYKNTSQFNIVIQQKRASSSPISRQVALRFDECEATDFGSINLILQEGTDTDGDGIFNHLDLDSDNDGIFDVDEAGHSAVDANDDGVIDGAPATFGTNGVFDALETTPDSDTLNYAYANSETTPDSLFDFLELDADGDGCFDAAEENIADADADGIAGSGVPVVDTNGLVTTIVYAAPPNNFWQNSLIGSCLPEICDDGIDNDGDGLTDCDDIDDCEPTANPAILNTCDNSNGTGSGVFFLHDANPTVSVESGMIISYHPILLDAQNDVNVLLSPYTSSNATIYVRVERISTGCYATAPITLIVGAKCAENCNNGLDEDGDGLIDCADPDCPCCEAKSPTLIDINKN